MTLVVRRENNDVIVRVEWMKDGPPGDEIVSRLEVVEIGLDEDGGPMTSCIVIPSDRHQARRARVALSPRLRHARDLLERTIERDGEVIAEPGGTGLAPNRIRASKIDRWRKECYLSLPVDSSGGSEAKQEAMRKAFMRVRKDLATRGVIKESGGWVWIVA